MIAWKLHGLAEMAVNWRPKDLADLWLLSGSVELGAPEMAVAIPPAFQSRGLRPGEALRLFETPHWLMKSARVRWSDFRSENAIDVPESLAEVIRTVWDRLSPFLRPFDDR